MTSRKADDTSWIQTELGHEPMLDLAVYVVDDPKATYHVPANRGHEVMV